MRYRLNSTTASKYAGTVLRRSGDDNTKCFVRWDNDPRVSRLESWYKNWNLIPAEFEVEQEGNALFGKILPNPQSFPAAKVTNDEMAQAFQTMRDGMSEQEFVALVIKFVRDRGNVNSWWAIVARTLADEVERLRALQPGESVA